ncbi:MAG: hypothetical protein AAB538_01520 [Patescibacteria group bacterium]
MTTFFLNFVWEAWHAVFLYEGFDSVPGKHASSLRGFVRMMTRVSLTDAAILTIILLGGAFVWESWQWYQTMDAEKYAYFIIAAGIWAGAIEYKAVFRFHQWEYNQNMPKVFGLGLSPLAQLAVTGTLALVFLRVFVSI